MVRLIPRDVKFFHMFAEMPENALTFWFIRLWTPNA